MSDEATIEEEPDVEKPSVSSRPETKTGLLPWSYIFEMAVKNWTMFLLFSLAVAVFLYVSRKRRHSKKDFESTIRHDHIQGRNKGTSRSATSKRD